MFELNIEQSKAFQRKVELNSGCGKMGGSFKLSAMPMQAFGRIVEHLSTTFIRPAKTVDQTIFYSCPRLTGRQHWMAKYFKQLHYAHRHCDFNYSFMFESLKFAKTHDDLETVRHICLQRVTNKRNLLTAEELKRLLS